MIITVTPNPALDRTITVPELVFDEMVRASDSRLDFDGKVVRMDDKTADTLKHNTPHTP